MDASFKKFAAEAGTFFTRAKQFTEEKLGQAEKTELDAHFENLLQRADKTKMYTEALVDNTRNVLVPNPNARMEESVFDKLDKKKRERATETEQLGQTMIDAANEFGPGTSYGAALVKVGASEQKLGQAEREFNSAAQNNFIQPLRAFLEGDMKTVQKERKILENKRLDLDAAKTRLRRAKSMSSKEQNPQAQAMLKEEDDILAKAEAELRVAQAEFDRQCEITRLLLEGISSTHAHHQRCLHDFVEAQANYYAQCHQYMIDLQRQLGSFAGGSGSSRSVGTALYPGIAGGNSTPSPSPTAPPIYGGDLLASPTSPTSPDPTTQGNGRRARVLYDYDAADRTELSLIADETIVIYQLPGLDSDWVMGERGGTQRGKVPITYLELQD